MNFKTMVLAGLFALATIAGPIADAKGGGGGSAGGGGHASASSGAGRSSGGFSAPAAPRSSGGFSIGGEHSTPTPTPSVAPRTSDGFSTTAPSRTSGGSSSTQTAAKAAPATSGVDRIAARSTSQAAFKQFQAERSVYKAPEVAAPADRSAARASPVWNQYGSRWGTPDSYYASRNAAFAAHPGYAVYYQHPPVYITTPSYGGFSSGFLAGILLDNAMRPDYSRWAYSHADDPGYIEWHRDMMAKAAENDELKAKMAALDQQVADLKAQNAAKSDALPSDVDPALVVAPSTALLATSIESSGHPILWTVLALVLLGGGFVVVCIWISQRQKRYA